jgi:nucleoside-diphosphate-sugar epimerase
VYNLAADMGGMGFIESNQSVLMWNNTMVSSNVLEAARRNGAERYFYSSTACVYNEDLQLDPSNPGLKEADAWPAKPQEVYGLEKLYHEEMALAYARDFPLVSRIARCVTSVRHGRWNEQSGSAGCACSPVFFFVIQPIHPPTASTTCTGPSGPGKAAARRPPPPSAARCVFNHAWDGVIGVIN